MVSATRLACIAALAAMSILIGSQVHADAPADASARVDELLRPYDRTDGGGMAVGVYRGGKVVYAKGVGMADMEHPAPITPNTVFQLASVSKQFTAFAVLLLAREGKLDLDADVRRYLPYFPDFGRRVTVRHLVNHTSGLREMEGLFALGDMDVEGRRKQSEMRLAVANQRALNFAPGTEYAYCNTGYELLAEIVRAVTGESLRQFLQNRVFGPLQMNDTYVRDNASEVTVGRASSYCQNRGYCSSPGAHLEIGSSELIGSSNVHSTVLDLARWAGNLTQPTVGDAALMREYMQMATLDDGSPINYGFGLLRQNVGGYSALTHTGQALSFFTVTYYFPEQDLAVAVLANTFLDVWATAEKIAQFYLPSREVPPQAQPAVVAASAENVAAMVGLYAGPGDTLIELVRSGGGLGIKRTVPGDAKPVLFRADGTFDRGDEKRAEGEYFRAVRSSKGVVALEDSGKGTSGRVVRFERVAPVTANAVNLRELVGDYRSGELDSTYRVELRDGQLVMRSRWSEMEVTLTPLYKDAFAGRRFFGRVTAERGAGGRIKALLVSNWMDRNIRFDRVP